MRAKAALHSCRRETNGEHPQKRRREVGGGISNASRCYTRCSNRSTTPFICASQGRLKVEKPSQCADGEAHADEKDTRRQIKPQR